MHSTSLPYPWGSEDWFVQNEKVTVKLLRVKAGEALSLQYHHNRDEFWKIIEGNPEIIIGEETMHPHPGDEFFIPRETKHRITAKDDNLLVLEIARGDFDEKDIVHLEDKYNRV